MDNPRTVAPPPTPEIDPELAEMEAEASGKSKARVVTERLLRTVLARRESKGTPTQGPKGGEKSVRDQRRSMSEGRAIRRTVERSHPDYKPDPRKRSHARLGRAKPVKSQFQLASEYKAAVRAELSRIKVIRLIAECPEIKFVAGVPGLKTVWQLSQAPTAWIHAIPGLGEKRRQKLHAYLISRQVPVAWKP